MRWREALCSLPLPASQKRFFHTDLHCEGGAQRTVRAQRTGRTSCYTVGMAIKHRFSIEEFERLYQDVQNIELLEGEIYHMSPIGPKHTFHVGSLTALLVTRFGSRGWVLPQSSMRLSDRSEPQSDVLLVSLPKERYLERLPEPADVLLLIEVSDSTLKYDREQKLPVYAEAGIPEYWIRNLVDDILEVYREPIGRNYRSRTLYRAGETVEFMGERLEWW